MTKLERQTRYLLLIEKYEGSDTATIAWQWRGSEGISPSQSAPEDSLISGMQDLSTGRKKWDGR